MPVIIEAIHTLEAGWLELRLAIWFGCKYYQRDGGKVYLLTRWRGQSYLIREGK